MFVKKVNLDRVTAVEDLFGRYITEDKLKSKVQKNSKRMNESSTSNIKINLKRQIKSRKKDKLVLNEKLPTKVKKVETKKVFSSSGNKQKSYTTFENPILKLSELFSNSQVKTAHDTGAKDKLEKDRICNLIHSLFCPMEKQEAKNGGRRESVMNEAKCLGIAKGKTNRNFRKLQISTRSDHSTHVHKKELHGQHTSRKSKERTQYNNNNLQNNELLQLLLKRYGHGKCNKYALTNRDVLKLNKITRDNTKQIMNKKNEKQNGKSLKQSCNISNKRRSTTTKTTDKSTQYNCTEKEKEKKSKPFSKFSYQRNVKADKMDENNFRIMDKNINNVIQENKNVFLKGDEEKVDIECTNNNSSYKRNKKELEVPFVTDEDRMLMREIQNLVKTIQICRSQISYVVQFSNTGYDVRNRTFSQVMEEAHFGKPLVVKNAKGHPNDPVNMPVEDEEFWSSGVRLSQMCANEKLYETNSKGDMTPLEDSESNSIEEFVILPTQNVAQEDNEKISKEKIKREKKKRSKCIDIIRRCLCLGKSKSSSEIPEKSVKPTWCHPVNDLYVTTDDPSKGFKQKQNKKRRPSLKVNSQKIKRNNRLKKVKSSKISCCIEWKGEKEGQVTIGKQCLQFRIDKWAKMNRSKDTGEQYTLQAVFSPNCDEC